MGTLKTTASILATLMISAALFAQTSVTISSTYQKDFKCQEVKHIGYTSLYSSVTLQPVYVCWTLTPEHLSQDVTSREGYDFCADPLIEGSCADTFSYTGTGYDRGHMCPAADNKWSLKAMEESFYMSNICLQDHTLNAEGWCTLEKQCRFWCRHYYKTPLYIACGPLFDTHPKQVGKDSLPVPKLFWKAVCRKDTRSGEWKAIGFIYYNVPCADAIEKHAYSIDYIETLSGLDLFSDLPDELENKMEREYYMKDWIMPNH